MSSFGCCEYVCVCVASAFPCAPSTPLFAPVCRFCLRGCMFSKSVCEPGCDCVLVAAAVGGRGCKDIKKEKKTFFFFPFVCRHGGASFSALSHGHKDDSDNPFIFLTSCRLQEDRWLLPRLFMALLISHSRSRAYLSPNPPPPSLAIAHLAEFLSLSFFLSPSFHLVFFISQIWSVWMVRRCLVGLFIRHHRIIP